jgi:hypothetical protein
VAPVTDHLWQAAGAYSLTLGSSGTFLPVEGAQRWLL